MNNPILNSDPTGHMVIPLVLIPVGIVVAAVILIGAWTIYGPEVSKLTAQSMLNLGENVINQTQSLFARGEYIPPGLTLQERNAYREAIHKYKDIYNIPPNVDVPKDILDELADAIKNGESASEAAEEVDEPPNAMDD